MCAKTLDRRDSQHSARTQEPVRYSTRINHVGALLPDTKTLLAQWDLAESVPANLERMRAENVFAKTSRTRIPEMLRAFTDRYLDDPETLPGLVALAQGGAPDSTLRPILLAFAAQSDPLLHDSVTRCLAHIRATEGLVVVRTEEMARWLREQVATGRAEREWSEVTIQRLAQGLLSSLRDFGVLQGKTAKRLSASYLPLPAFAFLAFWQRQRLRSGDKLLRAPLWELYALAQSDVERLFLEAHQARLLEYHAAGRVIRIEFPSASLEEYAHALASRTL